MAQQHTGRETAAAAAAIGGLYLALHLAGIGCPIRWLTGISCAGCGMTRAWLCAVHLDLAGAFAAHPLFWAVVPGAAALAGSHSRRPGLRQGCRAALAVLAAAFLAVYGLRLLDPADTVVQADVQNGALWRALMWMRRTMPW